MPPHARAKRTAARRCRTHTYVSAPKGRRPTTVEWAGFHTFRHTVASRLFAGGRNPVQVQRWLGHHSPSFTLDTYVHLLDADLGEPLKPSVRKTEGSSSANCDGPGESANAVQTDATSLDATSTPELLVETD